MFMKRFKRLGLVLAVFGLLIASNAGTATVSAAESSASLSIVPKKNYTIEAGKSVDDTLVIRNLDNERTLDLSLRVVDFTFTDDGGTPKLLLEEDAEPTTWSMRDFLTVPKSVTIPPKTSKTLDMNVKIPSNQGAGSYYSAIMYSSGSSEGGNVGLSATGVTLVFTNIPGEVDEGLDLVKFGAYFSNLSNDGGSYKFLTTKKPQRMAFTLKNKGNVTQSPVGSIVLKHMFGGSEINISDINPNASRALIGQTRTFVNCIKLVDKEVDFSGSKTKEKTCETPTLWPGRYSAKLHIYYGQNGNNTKEIIGETSFWYLPWWSIVILLILLGIIAYVIWRITRKVRGKSGNHSSGKNKFRSIKFPRKK